MLYVSQKEIVVLLYIFTVAQFLGTPIGMLKFQANGARHPGNDRPDKRSPVL